MKVNSSRSVLHSCYTESGIAQRYLFLFSSIALCRIYGNYKPKKMGKNSDLPLILRVSFKKFCFVLF